MASKVQPARRAARAGCDYDGRRIAITQKENLMAAKLVMCAKLGQELPALDMDNPNQSRQYRMIKLIGGAALADRIRDNVSAQAVATWPDYMLMVMNEYRIDPTSEESNKVLAPHMESFFFGEQKEIPNYVAPEGG
jgi:Fe-S cluster biosynthesis and repair protein YggX